MPHRLVLVAGCLAAIFAACGAQSDEAQIREVAANVVSSIQGKDWDGACEQFSTKAKAQLEPAGELFNAKGCPAIIEKVAAIGDEGIKELDGKVTDVKITGDKATARTGKDTSHYVKEDGEWKVDADPEEKDTSTSTSSTSDEDATPEPAQAPELTVAEQGFSNTESGATYGLVLKNSSSDDAIGVEVKVNLLGSDGDVLETATQNIVGVPAGQEFVVGGEADTDGDKVRQMEITATAGEGGTGGELKLPAATRPKLLRDDYSFKVRVQVRNTLAEPLSSISDVFVILRASNGKIIGGLSSYPTSDIEPGGRAAVELVSFNQLPRAVSATASADAETSSS